MKSLQKICIISIQCLFISTISFSQKNALPENYADSVFSGISDFDEENFEPAIRKFQSVPSYDSIYSFAQYELGLTYMHTGDFEKARAVFEFLSTIETSIGNQIYSGWAIALDSLNKKEEALKIFDKGISLYPHHYQIYYNKASTLQGMERYQDAIQEYKNGLAYAPGHVNSHVRLGMLAAEEGQHTRAMLSLMYAALMSSNTQQKAELFQYMEQISDLDIEINKKHISFGDDKLFSDIDLIFERKIALNKKVKDISKMDWSLTKQFQMICEAIITNKLYSTTNQDFWIQMYVPIFSNIFETGNYAGMIYFCTKDIQTPYIQKRVKKGKNDIDSFFSWIRQNYADYRNHKYMIYNEKWQRMSFYFTDNNLVGGIGKVDEDDNADSIWNYFHTNGRIRSTGNFVEGKRDGLWQWFHIETGTPDETVTYSLDSKEGTHTIYRKNNTISNIGTFKDDVYNGFMTFFYASGDTMSHIMINDGKRDSIFISYHENGALKTKAFFDAGDLHGTYTEFFYNDSIKYIEQYTNNVMNGPYIAYHPNGKIHVKAQYSDDKLDGEYELYHENGNIAKKGQYKENSAVGPWVYYHYNGIKKEEIEYDEKGKVNATRTVFDIDSIMYLKEEYKNGELLRITYFDKQGKEFFTSKKSGKSIEYKSFLPDGTLQIEGTLVNDEKQGTWNYYNEYGILESTDTFEKGKKTGKDITYSTFGKELSVYEYDDNELNGLALSYLPNGEINKEGYYADDEATGTWYEYYVHGEPLDKSYYSNGELQYYCTYSVTGKITDEYFYEDNKMKSQNKYDSTGVIQQTISQFHGTISFYEPHSKKITSKLTYTNGKLQGNAEWYYCNGKIATEGSYINGKRHGEWKWYTPQGILTTKINYVYGDAHGILYRYSTRHGKLYASETYEFDKQQGEEIYYHPNGKVHYTCSYVDDEIHGEIRYFSDAGNVYQIRYYNQGKIIGYSYLGKDGNPIPMVPYNGTGKAVFYYSNGTKSLEWERENGRLTGEYIRYSENGNIMEHETYVNHEKHGKATRMIEPGIIWYEYNYFYGEMDGINKQYHPNGKLFLETSYYNGDKHGTEKVYNIKGVLTHIREYYDGTLVHEKQVKK